MFGLLNCEALRGPGMVILQILRIFTLITLGTAVAACWVLIIKIDTSNGYFFFAAATLFFTSTGAVFFAISELPFGRSYFNHTWPVLSDEYGLTWLGAFMFVIGCNLLGELNQPHNGSDELGLPFYRLVMAAGILNLTFGFFNIVCSWLFHDSVMGINARNVRSDGSLAKSPKEKYNDNFSTRSNSFRKDKPKSKFMSMFWKDKDGGKQSEKPTISHPMPAHYDVERNAGNDDDYGHHHDADRRSPIVPTVKRPDTALHPMHAPRKVRQSSFYSVAHMPQF